MIVNISFIINWIFLDFGLKIEGYDISKIKKIKIVYEKEENKSKKSEEKSFKYSPF